jgi:pyruvate formate lyase activating enzyme
MNDTKEALLYEKREGGKARCNLCAHRCMIAAGERGLCEVRENRGGTLYTLVYGRTISCNIDPIEKKPLFHYYPGSTALSIATPGCNFRCKFCQNWQISQRPTDHDLRAGRKATPKEIAKTAKETGCRSISYTYTEPTIFFEYAYDTAQEAKKIGIGNNFVTNGYMTAEALEMISPYLDAANVDLKSMNDDFYRDLCEARAKPVLDSLVLMKKLGIWVEVTTLLVPGRNDSDEELRAIAGFVASELGTETPWHISRFHGDYLMRDIESTPLATLTRARNLGLAADLKYVYIGNVFGSEGESTQCYNCGTTLIKRIGFSVQEYSIREGRCPNCGVEIHGVWG